MSEPEGGGEGLGTGPGTSPPVGIAGKVRPCIVLSCPRDATSSTEIYFDSPSGLFGSVNLPACAFHEPELRSAFTEGRLVTNMTVSMEILSADQEPRHPSVPGRLAPVTN